MKNWSQRIEQISSIFGLLILCLLSLNLLVHHDLSSDHQFRFLYSGMLLAGVAIFYRFTLTEVGVLQKSAYRIALVMAVWSTGFYFFSSPELMLTLLSLPGFYFAYRLEVKQKNIVSEDCLAAGLLLGISLLLYVQQQPLRVLLYPATEFDWLLYLKQSPLLIAIGVVLLRLNKWVDWRGLVLLGFVVAFAGVYLGGIYLTDMYQHEIASALWLIIQGHLALYLSQFNNRLKTAFYRFCHLDLAYRKGFERGFYGFVMVINGAVAITLLLRHPSSIQIIFVVALAISALAYRSPQRTVGYTLTGIALLSTPVALFLHPQIPLIWLAIVLACLGSIVVIRRYFSSVFQVGNFQAAIIFLAGSGCIIASVTLQLPYLAEPMLLIALWALMPDRPLAIPRRFHWLLLPVLSGISSLFIAGNSLLIWACLNMLALALVYGYLQMLEKYQGLPPASLRLAWLYSTNQAFFPLLGFSYLLITAGFIEHGNLAIGGFLDVAFVTLTLMTGAGLTLYRLILQPRILLALLFEGQLLILLGFYRWQLEIAAVLEIGSPLDGYFLIGMAIFAAGLREILNSKAPKFVPYTQKTTLFYALVGWLYFALTTAQGTADAATWVRPELIFSSIILAGLFFWSARRIGRGYYWLAILFANLAIGGYLLQQQFTQPLSYALPISISLLLLLQIFKDHLAPETVKAARFWISLCIFSLAAYYSVMDYQQSILFPLIAAVFSCAALVAGIALQIRVFVYHGVAFFFVNSIGVLVHVIVNQPPESTKLILGATFLILGILFSASFIFFQIKRAQLLDGYQQLVDTLESWE